MAYPDDLPTRTDGSLGREKNNAGGPINLDTDLDASEYEELANTVVGLATILGLPNDVGFPAALATAISSGKVFALQQISTNGVQIAESTTLVEILAIDLYVVTSAQTAPSWRLIFGDYGLHLVPSDYGGAGVVTINGVADIVTFAEAGVYLLVGDGANAWTLTPATDYSAIDGAIASVQDAADAAQTRADDAYDLAQDAYNGLSGKLDVANHSALSVVANATNSIGAATDVAASTNETFFARFGDALAWTAVRIGMIADRLITWAKLPEVAAHSLVARSANSSGDAGDLTIGTDEGMFNVAGVLTSQKAKVANLDATLQSPAQGTEGTRKIYTSTPAAVGTASAGSSVQAAAGDHVHAHGSQTDGSHHAAATTSVAGFMSAADKTAFNKITSGTYTPTGTIVTNLDSVTPGVCRYIRVGDQVIVSGTVTVDPTASGNITFALSLPIASDFTTATQASGMVGAGSSTTGVAYSDATNDRAELFQNNTSSASYVVRFTFTYTVL